MKLSEQSRLQLKLQKFIFLLLFLSSIGMLAWLTHHYNKQFDLTANNRHSLSGNSLELLNTLNKEVIVHAYSTDEITKTAIKEIIQRYQRIKPDFKLQLLNPDIDIEQVKKDDVFMNKPFAFVIYYNGRIEHIPSLAELAISNDLLRLSRRDNLQVVFLSFHGKAGMD